MMEPIKQGDRRRFTMGRVAHIVSHLAENGAIVVFHCGQSTLSKYLQSAEGLPLCQTCQRKQRKQQEKLDAANRKEAV